MEFPIFILSTKGYSITVGVKLMVSSIIKDFSLNSYKIRLRGFFRCYASSAENNSLSIFNRLISNLSVIKDQS